MKLNHLTDKTLLADTKSLVKRERQNTTAILYHLKEIERRRLFSELGYSSLFDYAVKELGYSESAAMRRIHSARLLQEIPELKSKIENGVLSLSNLTDASRAFKKENIKEPERKAKILKKLEGKSSRDCGKTLLELFGQKDPMPKESIRPVNSQTHVMTFLISDETFTKLKELEDLLMPKKLTNNELMSMMIQTTLEMVKHKKFRLNATSAPKAQGRTRYISAYAKKFVYHRDEGRCQKCGSIRNLQFDHVRPYALGGRSTVENLRLLCGSCNQRQRITARL